MKKKVEKGLKNLKSFNENEKISDKIQQQRRCSHPPNGYHKSQQATLSSDAIENENKNIWIII